MPRPSAPPTARHPVKPEDRADAAERGRSTAKHGAARPGDADVLDSPAKRVAEGEPAAGEQGHQEAPARDAVPQQPEASGASERRGRRRGRGGPRRRRARGPAEGCDPEQKADAVGKRPPGLETPAPGSRTI